MTVKELKDAMKESKVLFGIRQVLKAANKKKKKKLKVFVASDAREDTLKKLEGVGVGFDVLDSKEDVAKELNLDFESEVYLVN